MTPVCAALAHALLPLPAPVLPLLLAQVLVRVRAPTLVLVTSTADWGEFLLESKKSTGGQASSLPEHQASPRRSATFLMACTLGGRPGCCASLVETNGDTLLYSQLRSNGRSCSRCQGFVKGLYVVQRLELLALPEPCTSPRALGSQHVGQLVDSRPTDGAAVTDDDNESVGPP